MIKKKISKKERKALLSHMEKKFGIPENVFKGYDFFSTRKKIYVCSKECARDEFFTRSETAGIAFVRPDKELKPTTDAIQIFGKFASKNIVEISEQQLKKVLRGEEIELSELTPEARCNVIITYQGIDVGCGFYTQGRLRSLIPKVRRISLQVQAQ